MPDRIAERTNAIDAKTSKVVSAAIGERLRADVHPEEAGLPVQLQRLLDELRARDGKT